MPFTQYTWAGVDLTLLGAGLVLKVLANHGALMLPPLPGAEEPTYIRAMAMRDVLRAVVEETSWHMSDGLYYDDVLPFLTGKLRAKRNQDPLNQVARWLVRAFYLGEGEFVRIVYQRPGGKLNTELGGVAGATVLFPPGTLSISLDGEVTSAFTAEWSGAPNRREPYLVLTPLGQRAIMKFELSGAWTWKGPGERWDDLLPDGDAILWRERRDPDGGLRRGRRTTGENIAAQFAEVFPLDELDAETREWLFGPADLPQNPIQDPIKRFKAPDRMARTDDPFFHSTIQLMEAALRDAEPYLEQPVRPPEELYAAYAGGRAERALPAHQRHPTGWAGTETIMSLLVAAWDVTYGSPRTCGRVMRERLQANWPTDMMAYKVMARHPRFMVNPPGLTLRAQETLQKMWNRLYEITQESGGAWGSKEEWPATREQLLRRWAPSVAAAATVALWAARKVCAFMRTDQRSDEVVQFSQVALAERW